MSGTTGVSRDRWIEAQEWEREFWERQEAHRGWRRLVLPIAAPVLRAVGSRRATGDDWNIWWADKFDQYSFLPENVGDYIELGCGPYTNTRLIMRHRRANRIVCSDPLVDTYLTFRHRWLASAARQGLVETDNHPIEEAPFPPASFDVVVLINVLDHVQDASACLEIATGLVRPGGYFILGQDLRDPATEGKYDWFEVGHPIVLVEGDLRPYLDRFSPVIDEVVGREQSRDPRLQMGHVVFAGKKDVAGDSAA